MDASDVVLKATQSEEGWCRIPCRAIILAWHRFQIATESDRTFHANEGQSRSASSTKSAWQRLAAGFGRASSPMAMVASTVGMVSTAATTMRTASHMSTLSVRYQPVLMSIICAAIRRVLIQPTWNLSVISRMFSEGSLPLLSRRAPVNEATH